MGVIVITSINFNHKNIWCEIKVNYFLLYSFQFIIRKFCLKAQNTIALLMQFIFGELLAIRVFK